jgi:hypothetical protein
VHAKHNKFSGNALHSNPVIHRIPSAIITNIMFKKNKTAQYRPKGKYTDKTNNNTNINKNSFANKHKNITKI